ncbi:MAG: hypothetical protein HRU15_02975 [Planctomycetes bacterium]|nr:hypothetical protein [Planctomycetota bacterium]
MSQQVKVLIYGAGKIGRGFIGQIMQRSACEIYFVDAVPALIDALNEAGSYNVHIAGCPQDTERISFAGAFIGDDPALANVYEDVDLIVSCVGARFIADTAASIKKRLQARTSRRAFNWIICENAVEPASLIRSVLLDSTDQKWLSYVAEHIGLIETQVLRSGMPVDKELAEKEPLAVKMQNWWTLPADADAVRGQLPHIEGLQLRTNFANELKRKLYTFNGLNGPIAYMGKISGYEIMHEAALASE